MRIVEAITGLMNSGEVRKQKIATEVSKLTGTLQPYADKLDYLEDNVTLIRGEDPIGDTGFRTVILRRMEEHEIVCWFLKAGGDSLGFQTGDLQVTMSHERTSVDEQKPASFTKIEIINTEVPHEAGKIFFSLKPKDQLKKLQLVNKCLEIVGTFHSGTE